MNRKYKIVGPFPAYGVQTGDPVTLDASDPLVRINVAAGVLELDPDQPPLKIPCPACEGQGMKRPPHFASLAELQAHYGEKHPALVAPEGE